MICTYMLVSYPLRTVKMRMCASLAYAIPYTCVYSIDYTRVQHGTHVEANAYTRMYFYTHTRVFVTLHLSGTVA